MTHSHDPHILLVEDDALLAESVQAALEAAEFKVTHVEDGDYALDLVGEEPFDVVLTDYQMDVLSGMELLEGVRKSCPKLPVVMMTAHGTADLAIEATKKGAFDYILKPFEMDEMLGVLEKAVTSSRLSAKQVALGGEDLAVDTIVGSSRAMQEVFKEVGRVAAKPLAVLIVGETGTGKELIARALCQHSDRADQPFVAVNCAAIPDTLIESELFGHERGAFTNAIAQRIGRFEQADGGTVFLDEIGDLPWQTQVKLLRVLQEKTIQRVGGKADIPVDVRIVSATHRDLEGMISMEKFREDLFYRLNAAVIRLPPLRERPEDIPDLVNYFLAKYAREFEFEAPSIHKQAMARLQDHSWPGNVRQLENIVRKALVDAQGMVISPQLIDDSLKLMERRSPVRTASSLDGVAEDGFSAHIAARLEAAKEDGLDGRGAFEVLVEDVERELYGQAVGLAFGNQTKIAKWVGVSRLTVREKLDRYKLFPKRGKD